jgi:hypothetical protein
MVRPSASASLNYTINCSSAPKRLHRCLPRYLPQYLDIKPQCGYESGYDFDRLSTARDADPIWAWNAPEFLTGERHGTRPEWAEKSLQTAGEKATDRRASEQGSQDKPTLAEKVENIKLHFRSREEFEKKKGGRTHYRVILSFDVPVTNQQIRELANDFLGQVFPKAIGFGAIHRDTEHPHAHIYLHSRQIDGKRIQLKKVTI